MSSGVLGAEEPLILEEAGKESHVKIWGGPIVDRKAAVLCI